MAVTADLISAPAVIKQWQGNKPGLGSNKEIQTTIQEQQGRTLKAQASA